MPQVIFPTPLGYTVISMEYGSTGLDSVRMWDNPVLGWAIDPDVTPEPQPIIVGSLPAPGPDTGPIHSPQWAAYIAEGDVIVPDIWRGNLTGFFDFIATNNRAHRKLQGNFVRDDIVDVWVQWKSHHPELVMEEV